MTCKQYQKYSTGKLSEERFQIHLGHCPECRAAIEADAGLMEMAAKLKTPVAAPGLWQRIEADLHTAKKGETAGSLIRFPLKNAPLLRAAAFFLGAVLLGWMILGLLPEGGSGLLGDGALARVEKKEAAYVEAITELERQAEGSLADLNLEMVFLYKARLKAIDDQILRCREALADNPANHHVRRYLLAALQDKKETLKEILAVERAETAPARQIDM
jgi:hypothetical protein